MQEIPEAASRVSSAEIVADAKSLIGIKYRYGGTTKAGFDCSGFLGYIYKAKWSFTFENSSWYVQHWKVR